MKTHICMLAAAGLMLLASQSAAAPQTGSCEPEWLPAFGGLSSVDGIVYDTLVFDDGSGPALYVAGAFQTAGGVDALNIARFDGTTWSAVGDGLGIAELSNYESVRALAVYDNGSGPVLYAAGDFNVDSPVLSRNIARWDGTAWQPAGFIGGEILDLEVYDDGSGPQLYAGGTFTTINGPQVSAGIARYDGSQWSGVGAGVWLGAVMSLQVHDDGSGAGSSLYVGGTFTGIRDVPGGGVTTRHGITRWNSSGWSALGNGLDPLTPSGQGGGSVLAMTLFDFGTGPELVVGGTISFAGGVTVQNLARWNGSSWSDVQGGAGNPGDLDQVSELGSYDAGSGLALVAGGNFRTAGGAPGYRGLAILDSSGWSSPGEAWAPHYFAITALESVQFAGASRLVVGGTFETIGSLAEPWLAAWDGTDWSALGTPSMTLTGEARALTMFDDGTGEKMYVAGDFAGAGGALLSNIARWNGTVWESVGNGLPTTHVKDVIGMDTASGPRLYAGGHRETGQGTGPPEVWEFDGSTWTRLPDLPGAVGTLYTSVLDLEVYSGIAGGPHLYAAGYFGDNTNSGTHIARWTGANWSNMRGGVYQSPSAPSGSLGIRSMRVFDDGSGERLWVAGGFSNVSSLTSSSANVASFDGLDWHPAPAFWTGFPPVYIHSLEVIEMAGAETLVACGDFQLGVTDGERGLAALSAGIWSPLPALPDGLGPRRVLRKFDFDGRGDQLLVTTLSSGPSQSIKSTIHHLDGSQWLPIATSQNGAIHTMEPLIDGSGLGPVLYVGGAFSRLGDEGDAFIARFGGCSDRDLGTPYCTPNPNSTGVVGRLSAFGSPRLRANDVTLTASDLPLQSFGMLIASRTAGFVLNPGGSFGNLCVAGQIGRYQQDVQNSGASGSFSFTIDLTAIPQPTGTTAAVAGESWFFQSWYRDANPQIRSNFTDGLEIVFE